MYLSRLPGSARFGITPNTIDSGGGGLSDHGLRKGPEALKETNLVSPERAAQAKQRLDQWGLTTENAKSLVQALSPADYRELRSFVDADPEFKVNNFDTRVAALKSEQVRDLLKLFKDYYEKFSATFPRHEIEDMPTYVRYLKGNLKDGGLEDWNMAILRDKQSGTVVGGYQYQVFHNCEVRGKSINVAMGEHLWLAEGHREQKLGPELGNFVWGGAMLEKGAKVKLGEMDDWTLMSRDEINGSSTDPVKRAGFWRYMNQSGIDAPWIQLRLAGAEKPCTTLKMCIMVLDQNWAQENIVEGQIGINDYRAMVTPYLQSMISYPVERNSTFRAWQHMLNKMEQQGVTHVEVGPNDLQRKYPQEPLSKAYAELRAAGIAVREDNLYNEVASEDRNLRSLRNTNIISLRETLAEDPGRAGEILANFQLRLRKESPGTSFNDPRGDWLLKLADPKSTFDIVAALNPTNDGLRGIVVIDQNTPSCWISRRVRNPNFQTDLLAVADKVQNEKVAE